MTIQLSCARYTSNQPFLLSVWAVGDSVSSSLISTPYPTQTTSSSPLLTVRSIQAIAGWTLTKTEKRLDRDKILQYNDPRAREKLRLDMTRACAQHSHDSQVRTRGQSLAGCNAAQLRRISFEDLDTSLPRGESAE